MEYPIGRCQRNHNKPVTTKSKVKGNAHLWSLHITVICFQNDSSILLRHSQLPQACLKPPQRQPRPPPPPPWGARTAPPWTAAPRSWSETWSLRAATIWSYGGRISRARMRLCRMGQFLWRTEATSRTRMRRWLGSPWRRVLVSATAVMVMKIVTRTDRPPC